MNDVKLHDTSLVKSIRSVASSPAPRSKASVVEPQAPRQPKAVEGTPATVSKTVIQQEGAVGQPQRAFSQKNTVVSEQRIEEQREELREAVTKLNDYVQSVQRDLLFELDDSSGKIVITVMDRQTDEVIRQIPDDIALKLARKLHENESLNLFNAKV